MNKERRITIQNNQIVYKYNIGDRIVTEHGDFTIIDREVRQSIQINKRNGHPWTQNSKYYKYKCNICGYSDGWKEQSMILTRGCGCCDNHIIVKGINTIGDKRPDLVQYFVNKEDAYSNTLGSGKKVKLICPICNSEKEMVIREFTKRGIACKKCGDGISYPEKFMMSFLDQLNINYIFQLSNKHFHWCESYFYDFYLPDYNCIVEMQGLQHLQKTWFHKDEATFHEMFSRDLYKKMIALENGIQHYFWIECPKSNIECISNEIIESKICEILNLDISLVDFHKCGIDACKNILKEVCEYYNNNFKKCETCQEISEHFKISTPSVRNYLTRGAELGFCNYDGNQHKNNISKSKAKKVINSRRQTDPQYMIPMEVFDKEGNSIGIFSYSKKVMQYLNSITESNFLRASISNACRRNKKLKGYTFKYITKEEYESRPKDQRDLPEEE